MHECKDFINGITCCFQGCGRLKTPFEHATTVCSKYRERVRRLSGLGMQISPVARKIVLIKQKLNSDDSDIQFQN
jgi:hypothetical protein